ncbi:MAG: hypothetical protein RSD22_11360 [Romboutsia sp.]
MNFMKRIKSLTIWCLLSILAISQTAPIYAFNNSSIEDISNTQSMVDNLSLENDLKKLENKHQDVALKLESKKDSNLEISYDFKSVEELDLFIQNFKDGFLENGNEINTEVSVNELAKIQDIDTVKWWSPNSKWPFNGLATWKHVTYSYHYNWKSGKPYYTSANGVAITSRTSGLSGTTWHQTGKAVNLSAKYSSNDTANAKVTGYYLCGVSINGAPIGLTVNDTWTSSLTLTAK